ncbi:MAG TPA: hypothetical protein VHD55_02680 [Candidatus Paceibacterota bacterium]|nr:hypothetical protein [Candidatus Paceibacterota bacterium]
MLYRLTRFDFAVFAVLLASVCMEWGAAPSWVVNFDIYVLVALFFSRYVERALHRMRFDEHAEMSNDMDRFVTYCSFVLSLTWPILLVLSPLIILFGSPVMRRPDPQLSW